MRTTLAIDDDVLAAIKAKAARERRPVGDVANQLLRAALGRAAELPTLPVTNREAVVTLDIVNSLRDGAA